MNLSHIWSEFISNSKWVVNSQNSLFMKVSFSYILQNNIFMRVSFTYIAITEINAMLVFIQQLSLGYKCKHMPKLNIYNVDENTHSSTRKIWILVILRDAPLVCFVRWWHVWSTLLSSLLSLLYESPMIILFAAGLCFKKNSVLFSRSSGIMVLFHFVLFSLLL